MNKLTLLLAVFVGSGVGGLLRYLFGSGMIFLVGRSFPLGTLLINVIGSFLIGVFFEIAVNSPHEALIRALVMIGILGGFTTFSTFSLDALTLLEEGKILFALLYVLGSVAISLFAVFLGVTVMRLKAGA